MTTITIERDLLRQALEALELVTEDYDDSAVGLEIEAIQALRAALAAPATAPPKLDPTGSELPSKQAKQVELPSQGQVLATAPDRHAQELLAQDITLQKMAERHAEELSAYELTVQNLRACGNEAEHGIGEQS